jgi:hypothetical protein
MALDEAEISTTKPAPLMVASAEPLCQLKSAYAQERSGIHEFGRAKSEVLPTLGSVHRFYEIPNQQKVRGSLCGESLSVIGGQRGHGAYLSTYVR